MKVIVDTCVWSLALRRRSGAEDPAVTELEELVREGRAQMMGVIRQEVLSGIRLREKFDEVKGRLHAFPDLPLDREDHERAAELFNLCREKGVQGSNTDFLVCASAERRKMAILTTDKDFDFFSKHIPVQRHEPRN